MLPEPPLIKPNTIQYCSLAGIRLKYRFSINTLMRRLCGVCAASEPANRIELRYSTVHSKREVLTTHNNTLR